MSKLESALFDLRAMAAAKLPGAPFKSTVDYYSKIRVVANLRPENTEAVFSGTYHTSQAADLKAFDVGIGDTGGAAGFGSTTIITARHTNLRQKRKPNDSGRALVQGILFSLEAPKKPKTTTNATTVADDSDDAAIVIPDAVGFVRDHVAKLISVDFMPYVQKTGSQKEYLGPLRWEATESGALYALFSFPEGYTWGGEGQGSEMVVGLERVHLTYNVEWAADTDRPWEDIADAMGIAPAGSQPAAGAVNCLQDVTVSMIGAHIAGVRP